MLVASLAAWRREGVRGVWVEIDLAQAFWIPVCAGAGLEFHHARGGKAVMTTWLDAACPNQLPAYPFTSIGVGGLVLDEEGRVLMMRERRGHYLGWKFPGGLLDPGEDLEVGAAREVEEETGIACRAKGVLTWRHQHKFRTPECSDMYFLLLMEPTGPAPYVPKSCTLEAADCRWFSRAELEALDAGEHSTGLHLWALQLVDEYRVAGFPQANHRHVYQQLLRRYGRVWNAYHPVFPKLALRDNNQHSKDPRTNANEESQAKV